jgi:hypothetical protein
MAYNKNLRNGDCLDSRSYNLEVECQLSDLLAYLKKVQCCSVLTYMFLVQHLVF